MVKEFIAISQLGIEVVNTEYQELKREVHDYFLADEVSDGYHTMGELYNHRRALTVALFNIIDGIRDEINWEVELFKSKLHNDGTMYEGYFIVSASIPKVGQISYHYELKYWDEFKIPEADKIPWKYDGHTSQDVIERLLKL
jgi:hypothetical protein